LNWRARYYEDGYLRRWHLGPPGESEHRKAAAMLHLVGRSPPVSILDLGCGHGRYAGPLAKLGAEVVAMDASLVLLHRALNQLGDVGRRIRWVQGEMSALPFCGLFDIVILLSAFGYFNNEGDDEQLLTSVFEITATSGHILLTNPNAALIRAEFQPQREERREGRVVSIRSRLDEAGQWLEDDLVITDDLGEHQYQRRQRLYTASELTQLLECTGYVSVAHFADLDGAPFIESSASHIVTVGQRAA